MKTIIKDNKIIVFLNKEETLNLNFDNEQRLESYFKSLFLRLKKLYNLEFNGYYNIDIHKDNFVSILEITDEEIDYYSYFNQIDMKINVLDTKLLYEISYEYLDKDILSKMECYKNKDKIYLNLKKETDDITLSKLFEYGNIIYGDKAKELLIQSKKVIL